MCPLSDGRRDGTCSARRLRLLVLICMSGVCLSACLSVCLRVWSVPGCLAALRVGSCKSLSRDARRAQPPAQRRQSSCPRRPARRYITTGRPAPPTHTMRCFISPAWRQRRHARRLASPNSLTMTYDDDANVGLWYFTSLMAACPAGAAPDD